MAQLVDIAELLDRRLMVGNHYDRATVDAWRAVLDELSIRAPAAMREWYEDCEGSIREHMDSCGWR